MGVLVRWLGRRAVSAAPSLIARPLATESSRSHHGEGSSMATKTRRSKRRKVAVFWDLDNKPPVRVPPFKAATCLKEMAGKFGEVVDLVAYANHHAFSHVPSWIHDERRHRKVLDFLEKSGEVKPDEPYVCGVCGAKKKTNVELTRHFRMLHEREQKKRMNRLDSLKGKKRQKARFWENVSEKVFKYKDAAQSIIVPRVGYGLLQEIKRAGVFVRTVKDEPQAADVALKQHMMRSIRQGIQCVCLVSDDTDFKPELKLARERNLHTVVVGDLRILSAYADTYFSWAEVATGRADEKASLISAQLMAESGNYALPYRSDEEGLALPYRSDEVGFSRVLASDGEEALEYDSGSDSGSDFDDDEPWTPRDTFVDVREVDSFDSFSDVSSDSDSESGRMCDGHMLPNLHGCLTNSKFSRNAEVPSRWRGFSTTIPSYRSPHESSPNDEKGASEPRSEKPERLHHFFTMLQGANNVVKPSRAANGGAPHFTRVQDILRPSGYETGSGRTARKDIQAIVENRDGLGPSGSDTGSWRTAEKDIQSIDDNCDVLRPSRNETTEKDFEVRAETFDEEKLLTNEDDSPAREASLLNTSENATKNHIEASEENSTTQLDREEDELLVREKEGESQDFYLQNTLSSEASKNEEEVPGIQRKGTRFGNRKPRIGRIVKVVTEGPPPFYMSGFTSTSQADCDTVNQFYTEWWADSEDPDFEKEEKRRMRRAKREAKRSNLTFKLW